MRLPAVIPAALAAGTLLLTAVPTVAGENKLAPLPKDQAVVVHGPYEQGACETCHERADQKDPGPAKVTNETCLGCHDEFAGTAPVKVGKGRSHPSNKGTCTACHNPHNSRKKKLLLSSGG
jgi:predicted CXXCH cytochrome family protein